MRFAKKSIVRFRKRPSLCIAIYVCLSVATISNAFPNEAGVRNGGNNAVLVVQNEGMETAALMTLRLNEQRLLGMTDEDLEEALSLNFRGLINVVDLNDDETIASITNMFGMWMITFPDADHKAIVKDLSETAGVEGTKLQIPVSLYQGFVYGSEDEFSELESENEVVFRRSHETLRIAADIRKKQLNRKSKAE